MENTMKVCTMEEFNQKDREEKKAYVRMRLHMEEVEKKYGSEVKTLRECLRNKDEDCDGFLLGEVSYADQEADKPHAYIEPMDPNRVNHPVINCFFSDIKNRGNIYIFEKNEALEKGQMVIVPYRVSYGHVLKNKEWVFIPIRWVGEAMVLESKIASENKIVRAPKESSVVEKARGRVEQNVEEIKALEQDMKEVVLEMKAAVAESRKKVSDGKEALRQETMKADEICRDVRKEISLLGNIGFDVSFTAGVLPEVEADDRKDSSLKDVMDGARDYLRKRGENALYYEEHVVREFLGAMFTGQIIILSGEPGTGKSSLPPAVAEYIDAECHLISVQPNWTDNQDLLGFYDPVNRRYRATPFMDMLADASRPENRNRIYIICLDEMNLSQVEYYFSEILSAIETKDRMLRLYSPHLFDTERKRILRFGAKKNLDFQNLNEDERKQWIKDHPEDGDDLWDAWNQWDELNRYPAKFKIPDNVQFVGTLNMDESTKNLSPKVLDRSYVIEVRIDGSNEADIDRDENGEMEEEKKSAPLTPKDFKNSQDVSTELNELKKTMRDLETKLDFSYSRRAEKHAEKLLQHHLSLGDVVLGKLLPSMRAEGLKKTSVQQEEYDLEKLKAALCGMITENDSLVTRLGNKLVAMYDPETEELNYWRR